jgi:hypothetical protein
MCEPASFVLTKDRVFWSAYTDSHEEIIAEHSLAQDGVRGPNVVRVELTPEDGNLSSDPAEWRFRVDQDRLPDWFSRETHEPIVRAEAKAWQASKVFTSGVHEVRKGQAYSYGSSQVMACDSSQVRACGSSQVRAYGSSQVTAYDSSQVTAYDSSQVTAYDSSQVTACGSSQVTACDSSQVTACGSSQVMACGSSQVTAYGSSQVTACDSSQVTAYGSSQVTACGSSQVTACESHATVRHYASTQPVKPNGKFAVVIDCRGPAAVCQTGE